ncbi:MAG TPA: glycosyltransferase family 4 protein [Kineosporiaceae bacterium]
MKVALSSYRSKPHSGGQGVYVRNLSRELVALGHEVEVFSGPPYPDLDPGVRLTRVPSLDLYRPEDPFRRPAAHEFRTWIDVLEYATMCTAGFPEPRTFSLRLARLLRSRAGEFDLLHDNQTLGPGILAVAAQGVPVLTTIHHPISADRRLELASARGWRRVSVRRWYGFVGMQRRVARRTEHVLTVSRQAAADITADFGVPPERMRVVPVGVDVATFRPPAPGGRVPGRIVTVASADVPLKGLGTLVAALARWRSTGSTRSPGSAGPAAHPPAFELVVVGTAGERTRQAIERAGLTDRVRFVSGLPDEELARLIASAQLLAVPSLYEGFSLPAVEAMACGTPVVASAVGALPELVGDGAERGLLVPPGDVQALAEALGRMLLDPQRCAAAGEAGRRLAVETYSWSAVARATAAVYEEITGRRALSPAARERRPAWGAA